MHLFDSEDPRKTQVSFYISTVLISLFTYAFAGLAVWWVGKRDQQVGQNKLLEAAGFWRHHQTGSGSGNEDNPLDKSPSSNSLSDDTPAHGNFVLLKNLKNLRSRKQQKNDSPEA
jgi:hypothetical protein